MIVGEASRMFALQQLSDIAPYTMTIMYHGWQSVCRQGGKTGYVDGESTCTFPISFPSACCCIVPAPFGDTQTDHNLQVKSYSQSSFSFYSPWYALTWIGFGY